MDAATIVSLGQSEWLAAQDGALYELEAGEVITMSPTRRKHGKIQRRLIRVLEQYLNRSPVGDYYVSDTGFVLCAEPPTVLVPDLAFVQTARDVETADGYLNGAPDLAIEVVSPTDSAAHLMRKVRQYLQHGGQTVWVVYPETREVHVFEASGATRVVSEGQTLEAPGVLPGFAVEVRRLFE